MSHVPGTEEAVTKLKCLDEAVEIVEFIEEVGGVYFRSILIPKARTVIPQHIHDHDHATYCGQGSAIYFVDGIEQGKVIAGRAVLVKAGKKHAFESLEDYTRLTCVHDAESAMSAKEI